MQGGRGADGWTGLTAAVAWLATAATVAGCATARSSEPVLPPGQVEARGFQYRDESGLVVSTVAAEVDQRLTPELTVMVKGVADQVVNEPPPPVVRKPPDIGQPTGHLLEGVDVVSSASVLAVSDVQRTEKWRVEGSGGASLTSKLGTDPLQLNGRFRVSSEPDYFSVSAQLSGQIEINLRNTTLAGSLGYGHDIVQPASAPPGEEGLWPGAHDRVLASASLNQLLSRTLSGSVGLSVSYQWGKLENPYRRARVLTSQFPERMPDSRARIVGFAGLAWFIAGGTALHIRQGAYVDSWGVKGWIPEVVLDKEVAKSGLVSLRYRHYLQGSASFYRPIYDGLDPILTGDSRLGELVEDLVAAEARWYAWGSPGRGESLSVAAAYELSMLSYPLLTSALRAQVFSLGVTWEH